MATIALTLVATPIDTFVMVGSAGIDTSLVPSLTNLRAGQLYTTAATADRLAPFGAALSGRANPNPSVTLPDSNSIGGAHSFSSDGDGGTLKTVDGHNPIGDENSESASGLGNTTPSKGHGYYDPKTQSLFNMARVTTGRPGMVSGGLTDTTEDAADHNRLARDLHARRSGIRP